MDAIAHGESLKLRAEVIQSTKHFIWTPSGEMVPYIERPDTENWTAANVLFGFGKYLKGDEPWLEYCFCLQWVEETTHYGA